MMQYTKLTNTFDVFRYVLSAVFSQDPLEKFFGQARQRCGGNFYIDIGDVLAAAKVQRLHQLLQQDVLPERDIAGAICPLCTSEVDSQDIEPLQDIKLDDTQELIESSNTLKQKVVFIAGFLAHKHSNVNIADNDDVTANVSCEFLQELDRGSLSVPTLSTAFLVHTAVHYECIDEYEADIVGIWTCNQCRKMPIMLTQLIDMVAGLRDSMSELRNANAQLVAMVVDQNSELQHLRDEIKQRQSKDTTSPATYADVTRNSPPKTTTILLGNSLLNNVQATLSSDGSDDQKSGATLSDLADMLNRYKDADTVDVQNVIVVGGTR